MNMQEYLEKSGRTTATPEPVRKDIFPVDGALAFELINLVVSGHSADLTKRGLFYKEPMARLHQRADGFKATVEPMYNAAKAVEATRTFTEEQINIIHAALGLISEAGEVLEEVVKSFLEQRPMDTGNLQEEGGDSMWYLALLLRTLKTNFETEGERNIKKLEKRYPEKFTTEAALNRDLAGEKEVLSA